MKTFKVLASRSQITDYVSKLLIVALFVSLCACGEIEDVGLTDRRLVVGARSQRGVQLIAAVGGKNTTAILFFLLFFFELKSKKVFYVFHHGGKKSYLLLFFCLTGGEHALISSLFSSCAIFLVTPDLFLFFSL